MALDRLAPWRDDPTHAGVLTDFDGTLAPIVEQPEAARPLPGVAETLADLARVYRLVGVISGRPVAYLVDRLASPGDVVLVGLYGLEKRVAGGVETLPAAERWRRVVAEVAAAAEAEAPPGVYVERKGLSVGLHVRQAPEHLQWVARWADEQAARTGLVAHAGKLSRELVPPVDTDKGRVVAELAAGLNAVCFLGDDVGDLPAFTALADLRASGATTMAVAVRSAESPAALLAGADVVVDGPEGALAFLRSLLPADRS